MPTRFSPHSILVALSGPHKWVTFGAISNSYDIFTRVWDQHIIYGNDT